MFEDFKFNKNMFYHFNFDMEKDFLSNEEKKAILEENINSCIKKIINQDNGSYFLSQGQYLIIATKCENDIDIYVTANFYHGMIVSEYKSVDWLNDINEE